ncbi:MAG: L,D-transpeptidase [Rhodobiaceae bacterium]|nr:L,D-transpeptidase [Rhodobiaceae bacterium]
MLTRRHILLGAGAAALAGCNATTTPTTPIAAIGQGVPPVPSESAFALMYGPVRNEPYAIPGVILTKVDEKYLRRIVDYPTREKPGTIIVDTNNFYLYLVLPGNRAMRYGVGLGRQGFSWQGRATIGAKKEWPTWVPPEEMIARAPELEKYSLANGGQGPGINNPLGARALYLFDGTRDTFYRIHGSREEWSIGHAVSSGCVRMLNQDIIDLYSRAQIGAEVIVS